jgi:hypothetical protein
MKMILLVPVLAACLSGAGCATQPTTGAESAGGEVYTGSRIPRKDSGGTQTIDGGTYRDDQQRMGQVNPRG